MAREDDSAPDPRAVVILYVDDERSNRVVFEHAFNKRFSIITKASAREALEVLEQQEVGVLVTDQRMPEVSGNELLAEVKDRWPDIVRIVITAYSDHDPILRAINDGLVARYVVKPWKRDELIEMLDWACEVHLLGQRDRAVKSRLLHTERLAMLGTIAAGAMHDISQPLVALLNNAESLERYAGAAPAIQELLHAHGQMLPRHQRQRVRELVEELPEIASDLLMSAQRATSITKRVKSLGKGAQSTEDAFADPVAIIDHVLSIARPEIPAGAHAEYGGPKPLPAVRIAPTDLFQVLTNLVLNAAQAVRRTERGSRIELDARYDTERVTMAVRDDGPGMSAAVKEKATKEFFSTRSDGTGLGLSQSRRLVEAAGGRLEIHSAEGEGTTMKVSLPRSKVVSDPPSRRDAS